MSQINEDKEKLDRLRALLLSDDRQKTEVELDELRNNLSKIKDEINDPEKFAQIIKDSKNEVIEVLGPVMGKLVKSYIKSEIQAIVDNIEQSRKKLFSWNGIKIKIKSAFFGVKHSNLIIQNALKPKVIQILLIEQNSGLLIGNFLTSSSVDPEMASGMLTAIKSFTESILPNSTQDLNKIEYSDYTILIQSYSTYYFASVISGPISYDFENLLTDLYAEIAEKELSNIKISDVKSENQLIISNLLQKKLNEIY